MQSPNILAAADTNGVVKAEEKALILFILPCRRRCHRQRLYKLLVVMRGNTVLLRH